jgi:fructoselysine-6-P-deglycase FrlB-like protein
LAGYARPLLAITAKPSSPLVTLVANYPYARVLVADPEKADEREGFFGSQTLISALGVAISLVDLLRDPFLAGASEWADSVRSATTEWLTLNQQSLVETANRSHTVVLATGWAYPCAMDFEAKCVEGGIGRVELTEAKNFTHGRFVNSFNRQQDTSLVLFSTADQGA